MEENERENMENPAKTLENPASSGPSVASDEATEAKAGEMAEGEQRRVEAARRAAEESGEKARRVSRDQPFPRMTVEENKDYAEPPVWLVATVLGIVGLLLCVVLGFAVKREAHLSELRPYAGAYDSYMIRQGGLELEGNGDWVVLRKRGKAEVRFNEQRQKGKWDLEGRDLTLKLKDETYRGSLDGQVLTLQMGEQEQIFLEEHLEMPEHRKPLAPAEPAGAAPPEISGGETVTLPPAELMYEGWAGNYYGWWIRKEPGESWHSGQEFAFWDVCGTITPTAADRADLELWDSQCQPGERLCTAQVRFESGITAAGTMIADSGTVLGETLPSDAWSVDPGNEPVPGMLTIEGSTGSEDYLIFLRPWGMGWEDVNDYPGRFFNDMMPAHYTDWYQLHREEDMPEYFVGLVFPRVDRG